MVTLAGIGGVAFLLVTILFTVYVTKLSIESENHSPKALRSNDAT